MKKGELRRQSIVRTAERLFFEKGYGDTSIQDILDELSMSKGGFYHHFDSKISLLGEICRQHGESDLERVRSALRAGRLTPVQKLDLLLNTLFMLEQSEPRYAALVLKISYIDGDVQFREQMRSFMLESLRPLVEEAVAEGLADGSLFTRHPGTLGEILLMLGCDFNDEINRCLARNAANPECAVEILDLLDAYRESVELLSGAGFGKFTLLDLEHLLQALRQTAQELNLIMEKA